MLNYQVEDKDSFYKFTPALKKLVRTMSLVKKIREKELIKECRFSASRSTGPGGQNVNKVNTQVTLRLDVKQSQLLDEEEKRLIFQRLSSFISKEGMLSLSAQNHRSQFQNKEEVTIKFHRLIEKAFAPKKARKATKPSKAAVQKRLDAKKQQSKKKQLRRKEG